MEDKREIIRLYFRLMATLPIFVTNVVIDKQNVKSAHYQVLKEAFGYNLVRIHNTLQNYAANLSGDKRFLVITDEGRVGKMRRIARKMEKDNEIPSRFHHGNYQYPIDTIVEDVISKDSRQSQFIQVADLVGYFISLHVKTIVEPRIPWNSRMSKILKPGDEVEFLELGKGALNLRASPLPYGIVYYPKP